MPRPLGRTGLVASRLALGTGTTGFNCQSAQSRIPVAAYAGLLVRAHALGVRTWDTSDDYGTYPHLATALAQVPRAEVVVTSKTWALDAATTRAGIQAALRTLNTRWIDVFLLHEVDSPLELARRSEALAELHRAKAEGLVRAVGLSTHAILTLEAAVGHPELDVLMTNYNLANLHMDASRRDYEAALAAAHAAGQGTIVMKTLAEGQLADRAEEAIAHNLAQPWIDVVTVGVRREQELEAMVAIAARAAAREV